MSESSQFERQKAHEERELDSFAIFEQRVSEHETSPRSMYPENILRYQENLEFWRQQFDRLDLQSDPVLQDRINEVQKQIAALMQTLPPADTSAA